MMFAISLAVFITLNGMILLSFQGYIDLSYFEAIFDETPENTLLLVAFALTLISLSALSLADRGFRHFDRKPTRFITIEKFKTHNLSMSIPFILMKLTALGVWIRGWVFAIKDAQIYVLDTSINYGTPMLIVWVFFGAMLLLLAALAVGLTVWHIRGLIIAFKGERNIKFHYCPECGYGGGFLYEKVGKLVTDYRSDTSYKTVLAGDSFYYDDTKYNYFYTKTKKDKTITTTRYTTYYHCRHCDQQITTDRIVTDTFTH